MHSFPRVPLLALSLFPLSVAASAQQGPSHLFATRGARLAGGNEQVPPALESPGPGILDPVLQALTGSPVLVTNTNQVQSGTQLNLVGSVQG